MNAFDVSTRLGGSLTIRFLLLPNDPQPTMTLYSTSDYGWVYLQCHQVGLNVDGQPAGHLKTEHEGRPINERLVTEAVTVTLTPPLLRRMGNAREIRGRICDDEFRIPDHYIPKIAELVRVGYPLRQSGR